MSTKKKGKKSKKTKEEIEAERKEKEEEENNIRIELEKNKQLEKKEREEKEEIIRLENVRQREFELIRLKEEFLITLPIIEKKKKLLFNTLIKKNEIEEWENYITCDPCPNANIESDINSYISTLENENTMDLNKVVYSCNYAYQIMIKLENIAAEANAMNENHQKQKCQIFINKLKDLIYKKLNTFTAYILQYADEYTDPNTKQEVRLASVSDRIKAGIWVNLQAKGSRNKKIDFHELGIVVDIPKAVATQNIGVQVLYLPYSYVPLKLLKNENINDSYLVHPSLDDVALGGEFFIYLLGLPPPPKRVRGWIMREINNPINQDENEMTINSNLLKRLPYPLEGMVASAAQPIKVSIVLPPDIIFPKNKPRIGYWDKEENKWKEDNISEINYQEDTNTLHFHTMKLMTLAIIQQKDLHFHKIYWKLNMTIEYDYLHNQYQRIANLYMKTSELLFIHIEIVQDKNCRLIEPNVPALKDLNTNYYKPGELLIKMANIGINIIPSIEDDQYFHYDGKEDKLELYLVDEIIAIAEAFEISSHNPDAISLEWQNLNTNSSKHSVFRIKNIQLPYTVIPNSNSTNIKDKHVENEIVEEYRHILASMDDQVEGGIKFQLAEDENVYNSFIHLKNLIKKFSTPDTIERLNNETNEKSIEFEYILKKLLKMVRLHSYCKPELNDDSNDDFALKMLNINNHTNTIKEIGNIDISNLDHFDKKDKEDKEDTILKENLTLAAAPVIN